VHRLNKNRAMGGRILGLMTTFLEIDPAISTHEPAV